MTVVLCNAIPLMALGKLNRLDIFAGLFGEVHVARAGYDEVVMRGLIRGAPDAHRAPVLVASALAHRRRA